MSENDLIEVKTDVRWIRKTLEEGNERMAKHDERIASLEKSRDQAVGGWGLATMLISIASVVGGAVGWLMNSIRGMPKMPVIIFALFMLGCSSPRPANQLTAPGFDGVIVNVSNAQTKARRVYENAQVVDKAGAQPRTIITKALVTDSAGVLNDLQLTQGEILKLQKQVKDLTDQMNKVVEQHNQLIAEFEKVKQDYSLANKAVWKRNWIILGMGVWNLALLAWIFRKPILWIAGRMAGLP